MKPFNLQEALSGKPVVTRSGKEIIKLTYNPEAREYCRLIGWDRRGRNYLWKESGEYTLTIGSEGCYDLFMASEKKTGWINVYRNFTYASIYQSKEKAIDSIDKSGLYITTIPIEWEE